MSDILIKGMEMPKERESFTVTIKYNGTVLDTETGMQVAEAYELPPHGRLIEDVAVREQIDEWLDSVGDVVVGHGLSYYGELLGCIEDAPTIIEAEQ